MWITFILKNFEKNINTIQELKVQTYYKNTKKIIFNSKLYMFFLFVFVTNIFISSCDFDEPVSNFGTKIKSEIVWDLDIETLKKKNVISEKYFNQNGKIIKVVNYNLDGDKIDESSFIYDINESKEIKITFSPNGNQIIQNFKYTYNESGRIEQKIKVQSNDTTNKLITDYIYDEIGNVIKITETNYIESLEVKSLESKLIYSYNPSGKISEIIYNNQNPENKVFRDSLVYDKSNSSLKMFQLDKQNLLVSVIMYNYNSLGNIILTTFLDKNQKIITKYSHIYTYH